MNRTPGKKNPQELLAGEIGQKAERKIRAQRRTGQGMWFGFGMMGLIGWSVVVPTLVGAAVGRWLDAQHWSGHSWTLPLLVAGLTIGCFNAWHWVSKEDQAIHGDLEGPNE